MPKKPDRQPANGGPVRRSQVDEVIDWRDLFQSVWNPDPPGSKAARFPQREAILREVHVRAPQPVHGIARATRATWAFPSKEELIKQRLSSAIPARTDDMALGPLSDDVILEDMLSLSSAPSSKAWRKRAQPLIKKLKRFESAIRPVWSYAAISERARREISKLIRHCLSRATTARAVFDPLRNGTVTTIDEQSYQIDFNPPHVRNVDAKTTYRPAPWTVDGTSKLWFNLRPGQKVDAQGLGRQKDAKPLARLRLQWEKFHLNQNFTAIEDFYTDSVDGTPVDADDLPGYDGVMAYFLKEVVGDPNFDQWQDDELTAIRALVDDLKQSDEGESFRWFGQLLVCAHYWVIPAELFLHRLKDWKNLKLHGLVHKLAKAEQERQDLVAEIAAGNAADIESKQALVAVIGHWASEVYGQNRHYETMRDNTDPGTEAKPGRTFGERYRRDFVLSSVVGGRAILVSDMLPGPNPIGKGSRTMIIDLGLNLEQRGRLLSRLMDLATFRILALREQPLVDTVNYSLNQIGAELTNLYTRISDADSGWQARQLLKQINRLSASLSALNLFLTNGVTGAGLSARDYRSQYEAKARDLRETRIHGYQTVREFLVRVNASVETVVRLSARYESIRQRLTQITAAVQANRNLKLAGIMTGLTIAMALVAILQIATIKPVSEFLEETLEGWVHDGGDGSPFVVPEDAEMGDPQGRGNDDIRSPD